MMREKLPPLHQKCRFTRWGDRGAGVATIKVAKATSESVVNIYMMVDWVCVHTHKAKQSESREIE